jgi:hypothetical protein
MFSKINDTMLKNLCVSVVKKRGKNGLKKGAQV